jgi:very-short-patch-repair endonuclease
VRKLFAEIPGLLGRLAPCVLMSPRSVAQFLGRAGTRFDLVVFDEASQIPMWDAVGAIGRGTSLVVVGDSRQLPPTAFFQRLEQGDEPAADDVPEDLESVLDECGAAGLPRMHLDWHYRSRHESLIAFSNHHYYGNRLLTFPAPQQRAAGLGVRCVPVAGVYDRAGSRQNRAEAEALVAEVVARLRDPERQRHSLGIVTFSQPQQVLIEDLLDAACTKFPEIEPYFTAAAEPVFVKNLENVQGDERDAILFSVCYGPDAAGKVYENYGPLNLQGGERRLNVAVTRARRELVVFTSVRPEQVALRTAAVGARHLRTFLDYALGGDAALLAAAAADPRGEVESPFEAAVRDALVQRGHEVYPQVGCSGYRIDLAVVDPTAPGRYLLGIECDGATYHSAATARDRDRLRASVLKGLGWHLHRVWSTDFWQDPQGELDRLEAAIAAAKSVVAAEPARIAAAPQPVAEPSPAPGPAPSPAPNQESVAEPAPADSRGPRPYVCTVLKKAGNAEAFVGPAANRRLREQVAEVLAAEAPLCFDRLARTVAEAWGVSRLTDKVRERIREVLPAGTVELDEIVWPNDAAAAQFVGFRVPGDGDEAPRSADELPVVEIGNAMAWLLRQHQALAAEDLAREAARCFGITRLGSVVRAAMERGIDCLLAQAHGVRDGETIRLP